VSSYFYKSNPSGFIRYDYIDKKYTVYTGFGVLGGTKGDSQGNLTIHTESRTIFDAPQEIPEEVFFADTTFTSMTLKLSAEVHSGSNDDRYYAKIYIPDSPVNMSLTPASLWNITDDGTLLDDSWHLFTVFCTHEITITDKTKILKILQNGITVIPYDVPVPSRNKISIYEHELTATYSLKYSLSILIIHIF
jgi:hypothetical protein